MRAQVQSRKNSLGPSITPVPSALLQRKCACGGSLGANSECEECNKQEAGILRKETGGRSVAHGLPNVHDVLSSSGNPLDARTKASMEARFGHNFGQVRIHADERAADSAFAMGAHAYTVGSHIIFARGKYSPESKPGLGLLAHELAHVVQQGSSSNGIRRVEAVSQPDDPAEVEAKRIGSLFEESPHLFPSGPFQISTGMTSIGLLQRQESHLDPGCDDLLTQIIARLLELKERFYELIENKLNLPQTGPMSVEGHQQQFRNKQINFRRMLQQWDTNNCGPGYVPVDAWQWAVKPTPSPAPSSQQQRSIEQPRDGNSITPEEVAEAAGAAALTVGAGYIIYRVVRFLPSLLPPLWWTIPANAAVP